jgi:hypothetical protein
MALDRTHRENMVFVQIRTYLRSSLQLRALERAWVAQETFPRPVYLCEEGKDSTMQRTSRTSGCFLFVSLARDLIDSSIASTKRGHDDVSESLVLGMESCGERVEGVLRAEQSENDIDSHHTSIYSLNLFQFQDTRDTREWGTVIRILDG